MSIGAAKATDAATIAANVILLRLRSRDPRLGVAADAFTAKHFIIIRILSPVPRKTSYRATLMRLEADLALRDGKYIASTEMPGRVYSPDETIRIG